MVPKCAKRSSYSSNKNLELIIDLEFIIEIKVATNCLLFISSKKLSIERSEQRISYYEQFYYLNKAKEFYLNYKSLMISENRAQDIPTIDENQGHSLIINYERLHWKPRKLNDMNHNDERNIQQGDEPNVMRDPSNTPTEDPSSESNNENQVDQNKSKSTSTIQRETDSNTRIQNVTNLTQPCMSWRRKASNVLCDIVGGSSKYVITLSPHRKNLLRRKKLCQMTIGRNDESIVVLCEEYEKYLEANQEKYL